MFVPHVLTGTVKLLIQQRTINNNNIVSQQEFAVDYFPRKSFALLLMYLIFPCSFLNWNFLVPV